MKWKRNGIHYMVKWKCPFIKMENHWPYILTEPVLSVDVLPSEWNHCKQLVIKYRHISHNDFQVTVLQNYAAGFQHLGVLGTIFRTQPPTIVDAECALVNKI